MTLGGLLLAAVTASAVSSYLFAALSLAGGISLLGRADALGSEMWSGTALFIVLVALVGFWIEDATWRTIYHLTAALFIWAGTRRPKLREQFATLR